MQQTRQVESWDDTAMFLAKENDDLKQAIFRLVDGGLSRQEVHSVLSLCGMSDQEISEYEAGYLHLPYKSTN